MLYEKQYSFRVENQLLWEDIEKSSNHNEYPIYEIW